MNSSDAIRAGERFKTYFRRNYAGDIQCLIETSRAEAMAQARTLLDERRAAPHVSHHRHEADEPALRTPETTRDPDLARRIVRELHAMRRQIGRNEDVLGCRVLPQGAD